MSIEQDFDRYLGNVKNRVSHAVLRAALQVEGDAKRNLPNSDGRGVDTGRLRSSITHEFVEEDVAEVGTNVEYALEVEFGTSRVRPIPYLTPAYEQNREGIKRSIIRALQLAELESGK